MVKVRSGYCPPKEACPSEACPLRSLPINKPAQQKPQYANYGGTPLTILWVESVNFGRKNHHLFGENTRHKLGLNALLCQHYKP
tara:strand:- start:96 stop:347 length:252 start_codon:yes stop_codon:yes gene_type:complete